MAAKEGENEKTVASAMGVEQISTEGCSSDDTLHPKSTRHKAAPSLPSKPNRLAHAIVNLPPAFFSLNMGTGITSILLHNLPYNAGWLQRLGIVIFVLNIIIFALLVMGNVVRYVRWKGLLASVNTHPLAGMFWGCLPMGFATIVVSDTVQVKTRIY